MEKKKRDKSLAAIGLIAVALFILWYMCIIIVPVIPNATCSAIIPGSIIGGGTLGGSSTTCPDPCRAGTHFTYDTNTCVPNTPNPNGGIPCPYGQISMSMCNCPTGYTWDTGLFLCMPTPPELPRSMACPGEIVNSFCPNCPTHYYWDTGNQACVYSAGV